MKTFLHLLLAFASFVGALGAQPPPPRDGDGPWNHRVLLATSPDGLTWTVGDEVVAERASVPELFLGPDGRPILLFVDASGQSRMSALGAMVRERDGRWVGRDTNLRGADPNVVRRADGGYVAYTKEPNGAIIAFSSDDGLQWRRRGVAWRFRTIVTRTRPTRMCSRHRPAGSRWSRSGRGYCAARRRTG